MFFLAIRLTGIAVFTVLDCCGSLTLTAELIIAIVLDEKVPPQAHNTHILTAGASSERLKGAVSTVC